MACTLRRARAPPGTLATLTPVERELAATPPSGGSLCLCCPPASDASPQQYGNSESSVGPQEDSAVIFMVFVAGAPEQLTLFCVVET